MLRACALPKTTAPVAQKMRRGIVKDQFTESDGVGKNTGKTVVKCSHCDEVVQTAVKINQTRLAQHITQSCKKVPDDIKNEVAATSNKERKKRSGAPAAQSALPGQTLSTSTVTATMTAGVTNSATTLETPVGGGRGVGGGGGGEGGGGDGGGPSVIKVGCDARVVGMYFFRGCDRATAARGTADRATAARDVKHIALCAPHMQKQKLLGDFTSGWGQTMSRGEADRIIKANVEASLSRFEPVERFMSPHVRGALIVASPGIKHFLPDTPEPIWQLVEEIDAEVLCRSTTTSHLQPHRLATTTSQQLT